MAPATELSLKRKIAFIVVIDLVVLLMLEGAARLLFRGESTRFTDYEKLAISVGIPGLNETLRPDPELFWTLRPSLPPTLVDGRIGPGDHVRFTMSTGPDGFRPTGTATAGTSPIVAVGDSCTFGLGVNDDQTFPARLAASTGRRVINAAVPGYSSYQGRLLLERVLAIERPSAVVITFGWNDATVWDGRSDLDHGGAAPAVNTGLLMKLRLAQVLFSYLPDRTPAQGPKPTRPRLTREEYRGEVLAMIRRARAVSARPILVAWPAKPHLRGQRLLPQHDGLRELAQTEGVELVDLFPVFSARGGDALYVDIVHASVAGNQVVADVLTELFDSRVAVRSIR